jgi:CBS domain-containing protein
MDGILFLTELIGLNIYDLKGRRIGRVRDAAIVPLIDHRRVDRFLMGAGMTWLTIRHDQVREISLDGIRLSDENFTPYHSDEYMLRVVRDLLDQQIIDAEDRKVVRVTDITFRLEKQGGDVLLIEDIDIGLRAVFRRLVQGVIPPKWVRRIQTPIRPHSIDWEKCTILEADPMRRLRLNISNKLLEEMHPADLADIVEDLGPEDREAIFAHLDREVAAETLSEVDPDLQASILESLEAEQAAEIVEEMSPDDARDVLHDMDEEAAEDILDEIEPEEKEELEELLEFHPSTAGGLMNTEFVALPETASVADALRALVENEDLLETLNTLFLTDANGRLIASVPLARLLLQDSATPLSSLAMETLIKASVADKQNRVAELFDKYNLLCLPVVDSSGALAGVITADDIISLLRNE